ncbi:hypothetical protein DENIT_30149 [Pseudomonas veronii]|nr:hypothetical protein DENIT_30149 [Pseudomonas veronii]
MGAGVSRKRTEVSQLLPTLERKYVGKSSRRSILQASHNEVTWDGRRIQCEQARPV